MTWIFDPETLFYAVCALALIVGVAGAFINARIQIDMMDAKASTPMPDPYKFHAKRAEPAPEHKG